MAVILNFDQFVGPISVAQLGQPSVANDFQIKMDKLEIDFLESVLGIELASDFITGIDDVDSPDQIWLDLRDGAVFNLTLDFPGYFPMYFYRNWAMNQKRKVRWIGFSKAGYSPLAAYVFFKQMRDSITDVSGTGIVQVQTENSISGVDGLKMRNAWNQMVTDLSYLWFFLAAKGKTVYTSYNYLNIDFYSWKKINQFNL